ncbi:DUF1214 domain-containing protein [Methylocella sp.]|uniref:DUF1214 domain-containing protein n=1 Tax=Methylocella sp. TaxID=1978226 RepID=UPI00378459C1
MRLIGKYLLVVVAGLCLGLLTTVVAVRTGFGFGALEAGPWTAYPRRDGIRVDPYARAARAHSGEIPPGATEGLSFLAFADSDGRALETRCDYRVSGPTPVARWWTLSALTPDGRPFANAAERYGFVSSEMLRDGAGRFAITLSRRARPGDWLPLGETRHFALMLRLYESEFSAAHAAYDAASMPRIERTACA